ncbi:hypothetical protein M3664_04720 [Paenibacillus lautus]|uniref:hypothetical protein n=1 Tax=Paenibacillus lautus TaxID=1401 RepID=UPI002040240F|nr:hypothetical protein [Paenibacillus lautus]MCM3257085.1 hypothetical protein [Paenibacillus lautus]
MNNDIFGIPVKYWLTVLLVPLAVNLLAWIPNPIAIGDFNTWVGFFGNYTGGIVGAFIALQIAKSQTNLALQQLEQEKNNLIKEKEKEEEERLKREKVFADVVLIYLYDEIQENLDKIPKQLENAIEMKGSELKMYSNYVFSLKSVFNYEVFNDLKYDIPKYDNSIILDAITPYKVFRLLEKFEEVNKMPTDVAKFISQTLSEWRNLLEERKKTF